MRPIIRPLQRRLKLLAQLEGGERWRALAMVPKLVFYRAGLRVLPFRRLARWALRPAPPAPAVSAAGTSAEDIAAQTSKSVSHAAALLAGTSTCLAQALTVVEHLRQHGVRCELCIGVSPKAGPAGPARREAGPAGPARREAGPAGPARRAAGPAGPARRAAGQGIEAHAWVEVGGQVVHGATERQYERFSSLEERL